MYFLALQFGKVTYVYGSKPGVCFSYFGRIIGGGVGKTVAWPTAGFLAKQERMERSYFCGSFLITDVRKSGLRGTAPFTNKGPNH
jgi:hypothetical protein